MQGDCLEMMKHIPDRSMDMVLTDPPYSSGGMYAGDRKRSTKDKYTSTDYKGASQFNSFSGDNMDMRAYAEHMRMVLAKCREKTREGGVLSVFIDWRNLPTMTDAVQIAGWTWRGIAVWNKKISRNTIGRYRNDCEYIVCATNGPGDKNPESVVRGAPGCYTYPIVNSKYKKHQTEKPVKLLEDLLGIAGPGWTVLDPFMGSGSTGEACIKTGRKFIGIEMDEYYFMVAKNRLEELTK